MSDTLSIDDSNFESKVLNSEKPVLVDFWAQWCGPCKMIAPILQDVAEEKSDSLTVAKVNVDESIDIANKYKVRGIPTLLIFKKGQVVDTKIGALSKAQLETFLSPHI